MQNEHTGSKLESVLRLLYQPIPYLPEISFLERGKVEQRKKKALARIKGKAANERKLRGNLEKVSKGQCTICGHKVEIQESTWIFGDIRTGAQAEMTILESENGFIAKRIVIL